MENELWIACYEFPNYEVSNMGRMRNAKTGKVIKFGEDGNGYEMARIFYNKKRYSKRVARLIWEGFNQCKCKDTIDHDDRNVKNNKLTNLKCIPLKEQYKNKSDVKKTNKYNLTDEIRRRILIKHSEGSTYYALYKEFKLPYNYLRESIRRGNWKKYL